MLYARISLKKSRLGIIAFLSVAVVLLLYSTSSYGLVKSCYDDEKERFSLLSAYGWQVAEDYEVKTVKIPEVWSEVYKNYNELQKKQGYDLSLFKGQTVTQYTYKILNHPKGEEVFAHILVYDGVIIGGDIMSTAIDGFMEGLK